MEAGRLQHRVEIQKAIEIPDSFGEPLPTWVTQATRWAAVEPLSGRELFLAQQVQADVTHRVGLRFTPDVTPKMRVLFGERVLNIESVLDSTESGFELELLCKEEV